MEKSSDIFFPESSWFKAMRSNEAMELLRTHPNAYLLALVIAWRARWRDGFNADGIEQGEAMLGDFQNYGMSEQNYRTAKQQLEKWNFATFKSTSKGTIGKLVDTRLFDTSPIGGNGQNNRQVTDSQRTGNGRVTTNQTEIDCIDRIDIDKRVRAAFIKPSVEEVKLQAAKIGLPDSEAEKFFHYYTSNGWRVGKNPMKSWPAAMMNWRNNQPRFFVSHSI